MKNRNRKILVQKGAVTILLTVMVLNVLLVIGLGVSVLIFQQIKSSVQSGESVVAFYAADAGAERCLYEIRQNDAVSCPYTDISLDFDSRAKYTTVYDYAVSSTTMVSAGQYLGTNRKVELNW
ncbi:MAG: hypothetical protein COY10_00865 [Candidatus Portnoybacteria bacterium CG_4_10_14_0_2_um_filter_43_36]|uniref:Type 4 fimbrial biogenesis protein PilX N-terminal domain-containing protein n=4 Tax=Candidatus Portnoyibacteriota TaxID=1817913 RepID=A0A2M7YLZ5_9BACT|nr:MAG: hypothetical protein COY85_03350 [Candidatus Portnoybacteria bacterium CG_4_10_14_0_8_um_filter_40_50]PIZ69754.1 MAG: hypothetical protein COY10_00865 [Candidatus Portnoybacteria bacterium CG_4_10_14_0_2_um_filter_43_36]PJA63987.1 MAG: hypothetical protein CO160_00975 [Candidatus Portnoybacteria bacterium CG_4_9_14_3_um_filter_43_11]PJE59249.1 MAG: hypothetical protein COU84_01845 [Candidatus Portnoybacteria bacterium CG10_big_fil_rev_8_21_14_0_10_43_39]